MLKETSYNRYRGWGVKPPEDATVIHVTRTAGHILSPSIELLMAYKENRIKWDQYVVRYKKEMNNEVCRDVMKRIKEASIEKDVYLVCFCWNKEKRCHRFLLIDMIENLCEWCGEIKKVSTGLCEKCGRFNHY